MASQRKDSGRSLNVAQTVLTAGGLVSAFGVASCCALPGALSMLGLGTASLVGIGYLAAQVQSELLYAAVMCLAGAGVVMWRQRSSRACGTGAACSRPLVDWSGRMAIVLAIGLLALTFWIEPPL